MDFDSNEVEFLIDCLKYSNVGDDISRELCGLLYKRFVKYNDYRIWALTYK